MVQVKMPLNFAGFTPLNVVECQHICLSIAKRKQILFISKIPTLERRMKRNISANNFMTQTRPKIWFPKKAKLLFLIEKQRVEETRKNNSASKTSYRFKYCEA